MLRTLCWGGNAAAWALRAAIAQGDTHWRPHELLCSLLVQRLPAAAAAAAAEGADISEMLDVSMAVDALHSFLLLGTSPAAAMGDVMYQGESARVPHLCHRTEAHSAGSLAYSQLLRCCTSPPSVRPLVRAACSAASAPRR